MKNFCIFFILLEIFVLIAPIQATLSNNDRARVPSCRNPQGKIGESRVEGCKHLVCVMSRNKAYWREQVNASSVCCSYQHVSYQIGENITRSQAQDLCTMVTLLCVATEWGDPNIQMITDSQECFKCASKEDLEAHDVQAQKSIDSLDEHSQDTKDLFAVLKASLDNSFNNTAIQKDLEDHDMRAQKSFDSMNGHAQNMEDILVDMKARMDKLLNNTEPSPQQCNCSNPSTTASPPTQGQASYDKDEMAASSCVGLSLGHSKVGTVVAVRRKCHSSTVDCQTTCANAKSFTNGAAKQWSCFDALHVYTRPNLAPNDDGKYGPVIHRYGSCSGSFCGPNYCCCIGKP